MVQILFIHGGNSYLTYDAYLNNLRQQPIDYERLKPHKRWRDWIADSLPVGYEALTPTFPNGTNAQYEEWVIYFEKIVPYLHDGAIIIGHSLGAMFLAKYLHSTVLPFHARRIVFIAGQHGNHDADDAGSFVVESAQGVERSTDEVHLFHSEDDPVVHYASLAKFMDDIPLAQAHIFTDRAHFNESTFPELLDLIIKK